MRRAPRRWLRTAILLLSITAATPFAPLNGDELLAAVNQWFAIANYTCTGPTVCTEDGNFCGPTGCSYPSIEAAEAVHGCAHAVRNSAAS